MDFTHALTNFFNIGLGSLNLFSVVLGAMWGLSTGIYKHRQWIWIVGYFVIVALYFAFTSGAFNSIISPADLHGAKAQQFLYGK